MASVDLIPLMMGQDELCLIDDPTALMVNDFDIQITRNEGVKEMKGDLLTWSQSLRDLPTFTKHEIEKHRQLSGKLKKGKGLPIERTLVKGRKYLADGYLCLITLMICSSSEFVKIKCKCRASMKQLFRNVSVTLDRHSGAVCKAFCDCAAGRSGYCNHVMALLLQLASFSLTGITTVPDKVACTSMARQWGIPGEKDSKKAPVMSTSIQKDPSKRGIVSTLYDPRKNWYVMASTTGSVT